MMPVLPFSHALQRPSTKQREAKPGRLQGLCRIETAMMATEQDDGGEDSK
jgi:hypothetical protein